MVENLSALTDSGMNLEDAMGAALIDTLDIDVEAAENASSSEAPLLPERPARGTYVSFEEDSDSEPDPDFNGVAVSPRSWSNDQLIDYLQAMNSTAGPSDKMDDEDMDDDSSSSLVSSMEEEDELPPLKPSRYRSPVTGKKVTDQGA